MNFAAAEKWSMMSIRSARIIDSATKIGRSIDDTTTSNLSTIEESNGGPAGNARPKIKGPRYCPLWNSLKYS